MDGWVVGGQVGGLAGRLVEGGELYGVVWSTVGQSRVANDFARSDAVGGMKWNLNGVL